MSRYFDQLIVAMIGIVIFSFGILRLVETRPPWILSLVFLSVGGVIVIATLLWGAKEAMQKKKKKSATF